MNIHESTRLMRKYNNCLECGSDRVGGTPSQGTLIIENEIFTRTCICGWSVEVNLQVKLLPDVLYEKETPFFEIYIHEKGRFLLPAAKLKKAVGVRSISQKEKIHSYLSSLEGRQWIKENGVEANDR